MVSSSPHSNCLQATSLEEFRKFLSAYLFDVFLPRQQVLFQDSENGGFHEQVSPQGDVENQSGKRLLSQCRQIFQFSQGYLKTGRESFRETAVHGFRFLHNYYDGDQGGWFFRADSEGRALDKKKDLYAHAFVLFALAHYFRATNDTAARQYLLHTLDRLYQGMSDRERGGFFESTDRNWQRRPGNRLQNPHMHLIEAMLALQELVPDLDVSKNALELYQLLRSHLFDADEAVIWEYFDDDWKPDFSSGRWFEPGHQFEWVWILFQLGELVKNVETASLMQRLFDAAWRQGRNLAGGGVWDRVRIGGEPVQQTQRIWVQTECIKALTVPVQGVDPDQREEWLLQGVQHLFSRHLKADGTWTEQVDGAGRPLRREMPATSGYHVTLALLEVIESG